MNTNNTQTQAIEIFNYELQCNQRQIEKAKEQLAENFTHYFPWVAEQLYKNELVCVYVQRILRDMQEESAELVIRYRIEQNEQFLGQVYNVRKDSSGTMHRECSLWEYQTCLSFNQWLRQTAKQLKIQL